MSNPLLFNKIAVAISFSPLCEAIIVEAKNLQQSFGSEITFIHVGKKTLQQQNYVKQLLERFDLVNEKVKTVWLQGETVEAILNHCALENIDLIVAGALEKENILKYFFGGVARQISRKTKCSMLMLCEPTINGNNYNHIVVEGADHPKTENTINTAIEFAKCFNAEIVDIIQETDLKQLALIRNIELKEGEVDATRELMQVENDKKIAKVLKRANCKDLNINTEKIEGKPGFVISQYARQNNANLLVLNGPDRKFNLLDRVFPHDIEYALADLPCNLLLVQPKTETE